MNATTISTMPMISRYQARTAARTTKVCCGHASATMPAMMLMTPNTTWTHFHDGTIDASTSSKMPPTMNAIAARMATVHTLAASTVSTTKARTNQAMPVIR